MKKPLFDHLLAKINPAESDAFSVLDLGCGTGDFLGLLSKQAGGRSELIGIDASAGCIREAQNKYPGIHFICNKFDGKLDLPDASFDMIVTIDVIECIRDKEALLNEFFRILKPRGKVLAAHWDWDTMLYNAESSAIARKAVSAFSGWKQPWMDECDGQTGRKLWGLFQGSGKFRGEPDSFNLIETTYVKGTYGFNCMQDIGKIVDKSGITKDEHEKLHNELIGSNDKGIYFFSLTSFIYYGQKA